MFPAHLTIDRDFKIAPLNRRLFGVFVLDIKPMFGINLGTRGADEARHDLEYCNHPGGTTLSEQRRSHGVDQPHAIKL